MPCLSEFELKRDRHNTRDMMELSYTHHDHDRHSCIPINIPIIIITEKAGVCGYYIRFLNIPIQSYLPAQEPPRTLKPPKPPKIKTPHAKINA